jgi:hypothetical protein
VEHVLHFLFLEDLCALWQKLYAEPFEGITIDRKPQTDLFEFRAENVSTQAMKDAAHLLLQCAEGDGVLKSPPR